MKNSTYSIIRECEYKKLESVSIDGAILDIGGSTRSGYHELVKGGHVFTTVNIDPSYGCDMVFDVQERFPLDDESYDGIICLNVLEHIFGFQNVFEESFRVLKPGGKIVVSTPFLFHIHGSPDDYFRYTKSALTRLFQDAGFVEIHIEGIGQGIFSLLFQIAGGALPTSFLRNLGKRLAMFLDGNLCRFSAKYRKLAERIPLGYFIVARKK